MIANRANAIVFSGCGLFEDSEENVVAATGVGFRLSEQEIRQLVKGAGFEPKQRKMDYSLVDRKR